MIIDGIQRGIVLDHIRAGNSMEIYKALHLSDVPCSVALIRNARSSVMERKDIIKIDDYIDLDFQVLGFLDPGITVNIIENGTVIEKKRLDLPERLVNILVCKNPRCITSVERGLDHTFLLRDRAHKIYRCLYCEAEHQPDRS